MKNGNCKKNKENVLTTTNGSNAYRPTGYQYKRFCGENTRAYKVNSGVKIPATDNFNMLA